MGFWIYLEDETGQVVHVESHREGSTFVVGGSSEAEMSITYNYSVFWPDLLGPQPPVDHDKGYGLGPWLHKRRAEDTIEMLRHALDEREPKTDDYWEATRGNAQAVLATLLFWASEHPEAKWCVGGG